MHSVTRFRRCCKRTGNGLFYGDWRPLHSGSTEAVGEQRTRARAIQGSCKLLREAARGLPATGYGRKEGVGTEKPEHHGRPGEVSKTCRLGTLSLRVLHVQGVRERSARSKV